MRIAQQQPAMSAENRRTMIEETRAARDSLADGRNAQAYAALNRQLMELLREDHAAEQAKLNERPTLTPEEAHAALIEQVVQAPESFHWEVWQRLIELHPEWNEADPGAEVVAFPGGKR